jgi:Superinfection immunity protein
MPVKVTYRHIPFGWKLLGATALFALACLIDYVQRTSGFDASANMLVLIGVTFAGYFLPSIIARQRNHHQLLAIFLLNLLLGWTGLGWIAALVWAATATTKENA